MNPNHVVNLELSKQLKKAGWEKETEFVWVNAWEPYRFKANPAEWVIAHSTNSNGRKTFPAPLATEILEELPQPLSFAGAKLNPYTLFIEKYDNGYGVSYRRWAGEYDYSLPNALAKMWIYLRKEGLI